jgi:hypothetical protein
MRPDEPVNLVEGVTLYHFLIEGIVGLTSERLVLQGFKHLGFSTLTNRNGMLAVWFEKFPVCASGEIVQPAHLR